ncbi:MAG: saccharopine dehydrogenase NADP-binding domain-containing protein, partial [Sulfurovum sp.]
MSTNTLIIGAGGVGNVVAFKCAMNAETFGSITLASRTLSKCDEIAANVKERLGVEIATAKVDADSVEALVDLIIPGDQVQANDVP